MIHTKDFDRYNNFAIAAVIFLVTVLSIAATYYQTFVLQTMETVYLEDAAETYDDTE